VKNDFVAMVSHDLRTPLTSIVGNIELVLDGDAGTVPTPQRRLLEAVSRNGRRLQNLIGDLLMLSRIESGTLRINTRQVPLAEVVDGALEAVSAQKAADVTLAAQLPDEPVLLEADPSQLERVLTNLIGNALKFTPPGGRVAVEVTARPERVELRISDTGVGIPADELPHIFDRFFRTSRSQSMDRTSTGLGLTIAKSIVERHRGSIWAESTPGAGSTFFIDLPRVPAVTGAVERERSQP
jgi:signal transduction histidine kinase